MRTAALFIFSSLITAPSLVTATTFQQTTVATVTTNSNTTSSGSVFNPFPLLGAAAPLATSPTTINLTPIIGTAPLTPPTGVSIFNPFPLTGAATPLSAQVQPFTGPSSGSSASMFPGATAGSIRPAATVGPMSPTSTTNSSSTSTVTIQTSSNAVSTSPPTFQSTITTNAPLALSIPIPISSALSDNSFIISGIGAQGASGSNGIVIQNPEPSTLWLVLSGLAAWAWRARIRSKV